MGKRENRRWAHTMVCFSLLYGGGEGKVGGGVLSNLTFAVSTVESWGGGVCFHF